MQPHCEQLGSPPNWQGVTRVFRSAEMVVVVLAKMQSRGDAGGCANSLIADAYMSSSGYTSRNRNSSAMAHVRSCTVRISGSTAPFCGVKILNQIRLVSFRRLQNLTNSSRRSEEHT